jgi:hypothetical protein
MRSDLTGIANQRKIPVTSCYCHIDPDFDFGFGFDSGRYSCCSSGFVSSGEESCPCVVLVS